MANPATKSRKQPDRVSVTAFISKDLFDKLKRLAADKDLSFSDVLRAACREYAEKQGI